MMSPAAAFENPAEWFSDDPMRDEEEPPRVSQERLRSRPSDDPARRSDSVQPGNLADSLEENSVVTHMDTSEASIPMRSPAASDPTLPKLLVFILLVFSVGLIFAWLGGSFG